MQSKMYYLFVDESGDPGDYLDSNGVIIPGSSKFFTLGGLIVEDSQRIKFENSYDRIMSSYFNGISLPTNFKLHYSPLKHNKSPYDQLTTAQRANIPRDVFAAISSLDCSVISVTIDLATHCTKYPNPANPVAYSLLLLRERFQYFLEDNNSAGKVIYERFNAKMRKKTELASKWLQGIPTFPNPTRLQNIQPKVAYGNPTSEPILQFADFFVSSVWIRKTTSHQNKSDWESIKHKYYNFNGNWLRTGNVEL